MHRFRWLVALAAVFIVGVGGGATPAYATAPTPTVTQLNCDSYDKVITCDVVWTGGEGNISIRWVPQWPWGSPDYTNDNKALARFSCVVDTVSTVHVNITDALGRNSYMDRGVVCREGGKVHITYFNCDPGYRKLVCQVAHRGGRNPITIRWYYNGIHQTQFDDSILYNRGCEPTKLTKVGVFVTDADGNVDWLEVICGCNGSIIIP